MSMRFSQGFYEPKNPQKYKGNPTNIIYRSGWELKLMLFLDSHKDILSWGSEEIIIPYRSPIDNKIHRYFVDLVVHLKQENKDVKKLLIEIKPEKFLQAPKITPRKSKKTILFEHTQFLLNTAKFEAAKKWCEKNGYTFFIMTEKDINKS